MSPDGSQVSKRATETMASEPMSLERKLELLEPRFTSPSAGAIGFETSLSLTAKSPSASHHSFSFEHTAAAANNSRSSIHSSSASNASNLPATAVRSKRQSPSLLNTSLHAVSMAAEKQMRKVLGSPTFILQQEHERSMSALASPPISNASGSNSTLITSHVNTSNPQVVAESPPTLATGKEAVASKTNVSKPRAVRSVLVTVRLFVIPFMNIHVWINRETDHWSLYIYYSRTSVNPFRSSALRPSQTCSSNNNK